ncbi:hypothetical protein ROJ8625_01754 [Roseivivax jejudonensis]|uniref:DUF6456 domain-containing protein n=1 Tax=Roseivivax jejudonensis TaxID=1529041 RepID=A0A1X6Z1Q8_9RHOB|nr:DUF6456 domain-containing protein [Roseivivax jejudonensis]SLN38290.1 hypothetical protein ROJ8625_01754 [Roseivivax jejudonensis]
MLTSEGYTTFCTFPDWVPDEARNYIAHTEAGRSLRALARAAGCHASTVMRQVRKIEGRREDPLVDAALKRLGARIAAATAAQSSKDAAMIPDIETRTDTNAADPVDAVTLSAEARRVLKHLGRPGMLLAVAQDMDKAVVVGDGGTADRHLAVDSTIAQAMALKGWIACDAPGRVSRYRITAEGRAAYARMIVETDRAAQAGLAEAAVPFDGARPDRPRAAPAPLRAAHAETPVAGLARRRDRTGRPFLDRIALSAAERLYEDYELARLAHGPAPDLPDLLDVAPAAPAPGDKPAAARRRLADALADLGPGLADMAFRCCCRLEGLETAEQALGWSARSGKIVLRIALQRLSEHYAARGRNGQGLIG